MKGICGFLVALLSVLILFQGCTSRDLRGWWKSSDDGKTYLVIDPDDGIPAGTRNQCTLDNHIWPYQIGERGEVEPGEHELGCTAKVGFSVHAGTEYHFDYWGP